MRRDFGKLLFGSGVSKACLLVLELGLAARLSAEIFGLFSIALALLLSTALLLLFGWQFGIVNRVSVFIQRGDKRAAEAVVLASVTAALTLGGIAGLLLGLNAGWIAVVVFSKPGLEPFLLVVAYALPAEMVNLVVSANLRARRQFLAQSIVVDGARNVGLLLLFVCSFAIEGVLIEHLPWWLLASWLGTLPGAAILWRDSAAPTFGNAAQGMKSLWQFSSWLGPWAILQQAGSRLQVLLAGIYLSATIMGVLAVLLRLAHVMSFLQTVVNQISGPRLARIIDQNDQTGLRWTYQRLANVMAVGSGIATTTMLAFATTILGMFGQVYVMCASALSPLLLSQLVVTGSGPAGQMLLHSGRHRRLLVIAGITVAILILIGVPSYARLGLPGFLMTFSAVAIAGTCAQQYSLLQYFRYHGVTATLVAAVIVNSLLAVYIALVGGLTGLTEATIVVLGASVLMMAPFCVAGKRRKPIPEIQSASGLDG